MNNINKLIKNKNEQLNAVNQQLIEKQLKSK
jgi:hypothetical protein